MGVESARMPRRLQNQMNRLFSASIRFVEIGELADGKIRRRDSAGPIVESSELLVGPCHPAPGLPLEQLD